MRVVRLLVQITLRKARAQARRHTAGVCDVSAEAGDGWLAEALTSDPGPAEAAALVDQIETLLKGLPALYCQVLDLRAFFLRLAGTPAPGEQDPDQRLQRPAAPSTAARPDGLAARPAA